MASFIANTRIGNHFCVVLFLSVIVSYSSSNPFQRQEITVSNGAYEGILIAIAERVSPADSADILKNIQEYFRDASRVLFNATRERVYFGHVTILVPQSWQNGPYQPAGKAAFQHANVIIDESNPEFGNTPYVLRTLPQCGVGGEYIHFTPNYILNGYRERLGDPAKVIVHEWGHLRWGLGDEYPRPERNEPRFFFGTPLAGFPPYATPVRCSKNMIGQVFNLARMTRSCNNNLDTGLPDDDCVFVPYVVNQPATASLMFDQTLPSIYGFCDNETGAGEHMADAPNEQNNLCNGRSAWEVMREHSDFSGEGLSPETILELDLEPHFTIVQRQLSDRVVLILDVSGSMGIKDYGATTRLEKLRSDATLYLRSVVPAGTLVGMVKFSTTATTLSRLVLIDQNRELLISKIPTNPGGNTCIGCGLFQGIEVLERPEIGLKAAGGNLFLISDGMNTVNPEKFHQSRQAVLDEGVVVDSILYTDNADPALISLARDTIGRVYFAPSMKGSTSLLQALLDSVSSRQEPGKRTYPLQIFLDTVYVEVFDTSSVTFSIDDTVGDKTELSLTYPPGVANFNIDLTVATPNGNIFSSSDENVTMMDTTVRIITIQLPGVSEVGLYTIQISNNGSPDILVQLLVLSRALSTSVDPVTVTSYISKDQMDFNDNSTTHTKIVAHVTKGYSPVLGADVIAYVSSSSGSISEKKLHDLGIGADVNKNDGVYTGYFLNYLDEGKYSVKVKVSNDGGYAKVVTGGGTGAYYLPDFNDCKTIIITHDLITFSDFKTSTSSAIKRD